MIRMVLLVAATVLEGCGPLPLHAPDDGPTFICPVNHTASCDMLAGERQPDPSSCVCVRNNDLNRMFRQF